MQYQIGQLVKFKPLNSLFKIKKIDGDEYVLINKSCMRVKATSNQFFPINPGKKKSKKKGS